MAQKPESFAHNGGHFISSKEVLDGHQLELIMRPYYSLCFFLKQEQRWEEATYTDLFFSLWNHPKWQRDCGIKPPSNPLVLALEKDNEINERKPK